MEAKSIVTQAELYTPTSLDDALAQLAPTSAEAARPLAGATWIMRGPLRGEAPAVRYLALGGLPELNSLDITATRASLGAGLTHARLAAALAEAPDLRVLAQAAARSANPSVRQVATLGGNLCAADFAAADLVPALLCLEAEVELAEAGPQGVTRRCLPLADFLAQRAALMPRCLVTRVLVPRGDWVSAHARLTLKAAGDYPVAIVSLAAALDADGRIARLRVAVGSVEPVACRWTALEERLAGHPLDAEMAAAAGEELRAAFRGRNGVDAPGRYRARVLPALLRRAVQAALTD